MMNERVVDPELALAALSNGSNALTTRERDVLSASLFGAILAEITVQLYLWKGTVRNQSVDSHVKQDALKRMEPTRLATSN
jgi:two-component system, NarL family, response regulator DesR